MTEEELRRKLSRAALETLRPLVKRMLDRGMRYGEFESALRELFVQVAEGELTVPGREQSDSRLALLTGLNRREVRRLRAANPAVGAPSTFRRNAALDVLTRWRTTAALASRSGEPKPIPIRARRGPSFAKLVREVTVDLRPQLILDELVRTGVVELRRGWVVPLAGGAYVPRAGQAEKLDMLTGHPRELVETMLHNVFAQGAEPRLQRRVAFDRVGSDALGEIRAKLRRLGERFTRRVNALLARYDRDLDPRAPGGDPRCVGLGVYYFEHEREPSAAAERGVRGRRR